MLCHIIRVVQAAREFSILSKGQGDLTEVPGIGTESGAKQGATCDYTGRPGREGGLPVFTQTPYCLLHTLTQADSLNLWAFVEM